MSASRRAPATQGGASSFLNNLEQCGLLTAEQFGQVCRLAEEVSEEDLPVALVSDGILTPLQAHCLANDEGDSLVVGPYHLLEEIGRGGMGRVYKARHTMMDRIVALKLISPETVSNERSCAWFLREVRSVTRLSHPNIVLAYDANEVDGVLFLAMEYVEGTTLGELVRAEGPLPIERVCEIVRQTALGLQHAHERGVVHRDIKPGNLLVPRATPKVPGADCPVQTEQSHDTCLLERTSQMSSAVSPPQEAVPLIKIVDFGLARLTAPQGGDTIGPSTVAGFLGTPDFASPEQCQTGLPVDIRSDLYSLGCTFHFALTGRPLFGESTTLGKMFAHVMTLPPPVEEVRPDVPAGVAAIVARLLAKNPDQRFQTPAELVQALAPWCQGNRPLPAGPACSEAAPPHRPDSHTTRRIPFGMIGDGDSTPAGAKDSCPLPPISPSNEFSEPEAPVAVLPLADLPSVGPIAQVSSVPSAPAALNPFLRRFWARWLAVIEALASSPGARPCSEEAYQQLYHALLAECARHPLPASEQDRACLRQLQDLVQPWLSMEVLVRTEPALLEDLARRARESGRPLGVDNERGGVGLLLLAVVVLGVVLALPLLSPASKLLARALPSWSWARTELPYPLSAIFGNASWLSALLLVLFCFVVGLLWRKRA
jgi:serine/threonine-protein kinase